MNKGIFYLILMVFILMIKTEAKSNLLFHSKLNISLKLPDFWESSTENDRWILKKASIATVNVSFLTLDQPLSGKQFQSRRRLDLFSAYQILFERPGSFLESERANADESLVTVYTKNYIDFLKKETIDEIVADYIFVSDRNCYFLTLQTTKKNWESVQSDLKYIISSFMIGKNLKEIPPQKNTWTSYPDWVAQDKNFQKSFSGIFYFPKQSLLQEMWRVDVSENAMFLVVKDKLYIQTDTVLKSVGLKKGTAEWQISLNVSAQAHPIYSQTAIYTLLKQGSELKLFKFSADTGELKWMKKVLPSARALIEWQNFVLVQGEDFISAYYLDSGDLVWTKFLNQKIVSSIVSDGENIACIGTGNITLLNPSQDIKTVSISSCIQWAPVAREQWVGVRIQNDQIGVFKFDSKINQIIWELSLGKAICKSPLTVYQDWVGLTLLQDHQVNTYIIDSKTGKLSDTVPVFSAMSPLFIPQGLMMLEGSAPVIWDFKSKKTQNVSILWPNISIAPIPKKVVPYKDQILIFTNESNKFSIRCIR